MRMTNFTPQKKTGTPLYQQLASYIINLIEEGAFQPGEKMPAVNEAYANLEVARDTIISAYKFLQENGWLRSVPGKGFYVGSKCRRQGCRLFVVFDAMNQYKETLYRSLIKSLGENYSCDTAFHYYDRDVFEKIITQNVGKYDFYVVIPHFNTDITPILKLIPDDRLLLLDGLPRRYDRPCSAVYQDFHNDLYEELKALYEKLQNYKALHVVFNDSFQFIPNELLSGIHQFYGETQYPITIERGFNMEEIQLGHCYMAFSERDLA
ncbi:MAG: winged helix-turn-helix transcriptional regulator, partial [Bacteroidaceae bacterium]|nr:winged helix-turn-helix transcriptional regulator [Bacteroidaceae bacterium]